MKTDIHLLDEPTLEFRYGQSLVDPHDGLSLFGPYGTDFPSHPKNIVYGIIGTPPGLNLFLDWSKRILIGPCNFVEKNTNLWPPFPGFQEAFNSTWPEKPARSHLLDEQTLIDNSRLGDPNIRTSKIVDQYLEGIEKFRYGDESYNLVLCIVPEEAWRNCRPKSIVQGGIGKAPPRKVKEARAKGQASLFEEDWKPDYYRYSNDFRRQIKARCMKYKIPIQIIRESTLTVPICEDRLGRKLTPVSDRAWNLSTTMYYKAGGKPWKLNGARDGVCYIGISFKKTEPQENSKTACCAAQMFLDSGDGIVFLGDEGAWYSPEDRQCHLSRVAAMELLNGILDTYEQQEGKVLKEIFLHSRSEISEVEFSGYQDACPSDTKLVGIRVRSNDDIKLMRMGNLPVPRGTYWQWNDRTAFLWASGLKWRLHTYDGFQIPQPLRIDVMHGSSDITQVTKDIFGLTKLNYNACKLGSSLPVTIGFSDAVGEILISNQRPKVRDPRFKFYI